MSKKIKSAFGGMVFSTDPNFKLSSHDEEVTTLPKAEQNLRIQLETKHRGGKTASVIKGFVGSDDELSILAKSLKALCGSGGSAKDGEIIIQGDHREKMLQWLLKQGYSKTKKSGG